MFRVWLCLMAVLFSLAPQAAPARTRDGDAHRQLMKQPAAGSGHGNCIGASRRAVVRSAATTTSSAAATAATCRHQDQREEQRAEQQKSKQFFSAF